MRAKAFLIVSLAAILSGCWTPPSASVRPGGEPRVIVRGIEVESVIDAATVESVDRAARRVALSQPGVPQPGPYYPVGHRVRDWDDVHVGDQVRATLEEALTVYVAPEHESGSPSARVLLVDPSYRLLTVQYPNRDKETFKLGLHAAMRGIRAGDWVAIRPVAVIELRVRRH